MKSLALTALAAIALLAGGCSGISTVIGGLKNSEPDYDNSLEAFIACRRSAKVELENKITKDLIAGEDKRLLQVACISMPAKDPRLKAFVAQVFYSEPDPLGSGQILQGMILPPFGITYPKNKDE